MKNWLINGLPGEHVAIIDRGFSYGDGLFETIAVRKGQARFFDYHLDRLLTSAERLAIPAPERALFASEAAELVRGCDYGTLKIILTRGVGERGYAPPDEPHSLRILGRLAAARPPRANYIDGVTVRHCRTPISCNPATAGLKTLGRLEQVLARAEWRQGVIAEGLMSTLDGSVICGTMSNLFLVRGGELVVPDLTACGIEGVMRRVVLDRADRIGLQKCVEDVSRAVLNAADELFITNSLIGLWPVRRVGDTEYPVGPITLKLMAQLADAGIVECADL